MKRLKNYYHENYIIKNLFSQFIARKKSSVLNFHKILSKRCFTKVLRSIFQETKPTSRYTSPPAEGPEKRDVLADDAVVDVLDELAGILALLRGQGLGRPRRRHDLGPGGLLRERVDSALRAPGLPGSDLHAAAHARISRRERTGSAPSDLDPLRESPAGARRARAALFRNLGGTAWVRGVLWYRGNVHRLPFFLLFYSFATLAGRESRVERRG